MNSQPPVSSPLFDFLLIGPLGIGLLLFFLAAGLVFFFLSFSKRHGRSRWPLHALMALGIVAGGSGLMFAGTSAARLLHSWSLTGGEDPGNWGLYLAESLIGVFWFGLVGALLGSFALIRAVAGLIREPGPRF